MKTMNKKNKLVTQMREIRDKLNLELAELSPSEHQEFISSQLKYMKNKRISGKTKDYFKNQR